MTDISFIPEPAATADRPDDGSQSVGQGCNNAVMQAWKSAVVAGSGLNNWPLLRSLYCIWAVCLQ
jgi:hypothetical protein